MPTDAATQIIAAVVSPWTSPPWRRIAPAPRNPTPVTICAAIRVGSTPDLKAGSRPTPVNMHAPTAISDMVLSPAGCPRYSRSTPRARPRRRATRRRTPKSSSLPCRGSGSAPARSAAGLVLRPGLVGQLGQVEAVHEISEDGEALLVDRRLGLVLRSSLLVPVGDDARRLHDLLGDEDRALDTHRQGDGVGRPGVEIEVASVLLHVQPGVENLVSQPRHHDALDADPEVAERGGHQVVRQGPAERVA